MGTPVLVGPGASVDRSSAQPFSWSWTPSRAGEQLTGWQLQYRLVGSGTWLVATDPLTATEQIPNGDGTTITGWSIYYAPGGIGPYTFAVNGSGGRSGAGVEITANGGGGGAVVFRPGVNSTPVVPGASYVFSAWTAGIDAALATYPITVSVAYYNSGDTYVGGANGNAVPQLGNTTYQLLATESVAPATASYAIVTLSWNIPNSYPVRLRVDDVSFKRVDLDPKTLLAGTANDFGLRGAALGTGSGDASMFANFLAAGNYEARWVATMAGGGGLTPLTYASNTVTFTMVQPSAAPTVTVPAANAVIPTAQSNVTLTYASGQNQAQVRVLDGSTVKWDSGTVVASGTTATIAATFADNGTARTVQARTGVSGVWGSWANVAVTVAYTVPATPTFTCAGEDTYGLGFNHAARVVVTNPAPTGTQPTVTSYTVEWRQVGTTAWKAAGGAAAGTPFVWYAAPSLPMQMRVTVYGNNGTTTTTGAQTVTPAVLVKGVVIYDPANPSGVKVFRLNDEGVDDTEKMENALLSFSGRAYPVAEFGVGVERQISVPVLNLRTDADLAALKAFLRGRAAVVYCDRRGRAVLAAMSTGPVKDTFYGYTTALVFDVLDSWGV